MRNFLGFPVDGDNDTTHKISCRFSSINKVIFLMYNVIIKLTYTIQKDYNTCKPHDLRVIYLFIHS